MPGIPPQPAPPPHVALLDLDAGNVRSVANALTHLGVDYALVRTPEALAGATRIILPGVGAFAALMEKLRDRGMIPALEAAVLGQGVPFLGICVGMQVLCDVGLEFGETPGLGWIPGRCGPLNGARDAGLPVPHVGWNDVEPAVGRPLDPLLAGTTADDRVFYYVHSFHVETADPDHVVATSSYGQAVTAMMRRGHIAGVQFHPEKSQTAGLQLLRAFALANP